MLRQLTTASFEESRATSRRSVSAIGKRVNHDIRNPCGLRCGCEGNEMLVMTMNTTIGDQSKKMKPMATSALEGLLHDRIASEFALSDGFVDPSKVLINDASRPEIEMANLRVSHLSLGQSDIEAARA